MFNKEAEFEKEAEDNKPPYAFCTLDTNIIRLGGINESIH